MASASIPLHCTICPRKPKFSDVSHLLTHIASKGHLSYYYKLKVRSGTENGARLVVETYDRWYAEWNVEDLMSERMSLKDRKAPRSKAASKQRGTLSASSTTSTSRRGKAPKALDPRLQDHGIKKEAIPTPPLTFSQAKYFPPIPPHLASWPSNPSTPFGNASLDSEIISTDSDFLAFARLPGSPNNDSVICEADGEVTVVSENTKLKGVFWPGMDIFDSATPEMRRKRNQKKDISVVEQLEQNSQEVEPNEMIFTPLGSLKRQRRISGSAYEDSSPLRSEPSPKKPVLRRPVLGDLDINVGRNPIPNRQQSAHGFTRYPPPMKQMGRGFSNGTPSNPKSRAFDVFRDQEVSFGRPAGFSHLTAEFRHPDFRHPTVPIGRPEQSMFHYDQKENYGPRRFAQARQHLAQPYFPFNNPSIPPYFGHFPAPESSDFYPNPPVFGPFDCADPEFDDQRTITAPNSDS